MANGGTFTLKVKTINTRTASPGQWIKFLGVGPFTYSTATDQNLIDIINGVLTPYYIFLYESLAIPPAGTSVGGSASLKFGIDNTSIVLVGASGGTYAFSGLPSGFQMSSPVLNICGGAGGAGSTTLYKRNFTTILTDSTGAEAANNIALDNPVTPLSILLDSYGMDVSTIAGLVAPGSATAALFSPSIAIDGTFTLPIISITGTYTLQSFSWTITPNTNVKAGDKVTINANVTPGGLNGVTQIHVQYIDTNGNLHDTVVSDFIIQTPQQIIFVMPQFGNPPPGQIVSIYVTDKGTVFTGSVFVGTLTVTFADASGIYVLTPGKTTDTIYDRSTPGATKEVNIIDPTIETAFVP